MEDFSDISSFALIYKQSVCQLLTKKEKNKKFFEKGGKRLKNKKPGLTICLKTSRQTRRFFDGFIKKRGEVGNLMIQN